MSLRDGRWTWLGLVGLVGLALLPFLYLFDIAPQTSDAVEWLRKADPSYRRWLTWTFGTRQFEVTLRPVAALSYTASWLVGGLDVRPHRLVDLALHGLVIALTFAVIRRRSSGAPWAALAGASVVALHPLAAFVLTDLARRSYTLASVLMLATLLVAPAATDSPDRRRRWGVATASLAAAAALSHEVGYLAFALAAVLVVVPTERLTDLEAWRDAVSRQRWLLGASGVLVVGLLIWRALVFLGFGGYRRGVVTPLATAQATLESLFPLFAVDGSGLSSALWAAIVLGACLAVFATDRGRDPLARVALTWLVGALGLFVVQPVWFVRQVYLLVAPLGLLVGTTIGAPRPRGIGLATAALPLGLVLLVPAHLDMIAEERLRAQATTAMTEELVETARSVPEGGRLVVAVPYWRRPLVDHRPEREVPAKGERSQAPRPPNSMRAPLQWAAEVVPRRKLVLGLVAFTTFDETEPIWSAKVDGRTLELDVKGERRLEGPRFLDHWTIDGNQGTVQLEADDAPLWVFFHDGQSGRHWVVDP